jgi:hypothetical protein
MKKGGIASRRCVRRPPGADGHNIVKKLVKLNRLPYVQFLTGFLHHDLQENFHLTARRTVVKETVVFFTLLFGIRVVTPHMPRGEIEKINARSFGVSAADYEQQLAKEVSGGF